MAKQGFVFSFGSFVSLFVCLFVLISMFRLFFLSFHSYFHCHFSARLSHSLYHFVSIHSFYLHHVFLFFSILPFFKTMFQSIYPQILLSFSNPFCLFFFLQFSSSNHLFFFRSFSFLSSDFSASCPSLSRLCSSFLYFSIVPFHCIPCQCIFAVYFICVLSKALTCLYVLFYVFYM